MFDFENGLAQGKITTIYLTATDTNIVMLITSQIFKLSKIMFYIFFLTIYSVIHGKVLVKWILRILYNFMGYQGPSF